MLGLNSTDSTVKLSETNLNRIWLRYATVSGPQPHPHSFGCMDITAHEVTWIQMEIDGRSDKFKLLGTKLDGHILQLGFVK